jgi:hypothetical protein
MRDLPRSRPIPAPCERSPAVHAFLGSERFALATEDAPVRTQMAASMLAATLGGEWAALAQERDDVEVALTVSAHVTDYANVSRRTLADAQAHATVAYRDAGLDVIWSSAPWSPDDESLSTGYRLIDVRIVILAAEMAEKMCRERGLGESVMGHATSAATEARGRIVYIFYHRIYRIAASHSTSVQRGFGHVMAHEIGHVLLGVNSHSTEGLMRARWEPWDSRLQTFTTSEVLHIRRRFSATAP